MIRRGPDDGKSGHGVACRRGRFATDYAAETWSSMGGQGERSGVCSARPRSPGQSSLQAHNLKVVGSNPALMESFP